MGQKDLFSICDEGSDKASAINVQGYAEDFLRQLFEIHMVKDAEISDLFEGYGPLATFAARIKVSFALGMIDAQMQKDLHYIRKIRNEFSHCKEPISYDESPIRELRKNLSTANKYENEDKDSRWKYMKAGVEVLSGLYFFVEKAKCK